MVGQTSVRNFDSHLSVGPMRTQRSAPRAAPVTIADFLARIPALRHLEHCLQLVVDGSVKWWDEVSATIDTPLEVGRSLLLQHG